MVRHIAKTRASRGFTLIELAVTIAVAAILLMVTIPSFYDMIMRNRLRNAAEQMRTDLTLARTEALRRNDRVYVTFTRDASGSPWCYGMSLTPGCDCTVTDTSSASFCFLDRTDPADNTSTPLRRVVSSDQYPQVTMDDEPDEISFSPNRPTLASDSATLIANDKRVQVIWFNNGRIRFCSPADYYLFYFDEC